MSWVSSGGTRAKKVLIDPAGKEYFFKCSEKKPPKNGNPEKHYKYEFWNEIIAYQLGRQLGLNMLRYDLAVYKNEIGCISSNMIKPNQEQLIEVGRLMTAIDSNFTPETNNSRKQYTFQLLETTVSKFQFEKYWERFFQIILFDALIGNTDRHQENWAFIGLTEITNIITSSLKNQDEIAVTGQLLKNISQIVIKEASKSEQLPILKYVLNINRFAPIYDSGSSLGRELTESKILELLKNEDELENYINKGMAELHWENLKISHFDLIEKIKLTKFNASLQNASQFLNNWESVNLNLIFDNITDSLPNDWKHYDFTRVYDKFVISGI